jgi:Flp pilus assembly protein TadD
MRGSLVALAVVVACAFVVAGCGGSGGKSGSTGSSRLSKAAYRSRLKRAAREAGAAQAAVGKAASKAKSVADVQTALRSFAAAYDRLGKQVAGLKAPQDAAAANAELAKGERDDAAETRAIVPKLSKFKTVQQAFGYLQQVGHTKGGAEQDKALATLKTLGYTAGS